MTPPFLRSKFGMKWIELSVSLLKSTKLLDVSEISLASPEDGMSILLSLDGSNDEIPFRSGPLDTFFPVSYSFLSSGEGDKF